MKDEKSIKRFASKYDIEIQEYTEVGFIPEKALKAGAVKVVSLMHRTQNASLMDFALNEKGECVGYSTDAANSFVKRRM